MNMQDYRHAADRVHIAEHCEKEVLSMTQNTEQKTRRPLLRTATGIAAAAACVGLTGALGFALYRMGHDDSVLPAVESVETADVTELTDADSAAEPVQDESITETYEDYLAAYYEKVAGHPVNYDWSSLCGTNLNEVWETENGTVTLKAAVTDGYQVHYFYTFRPSFDWNSAREDERDEKVPDVLLCMESKDFVSDKVYSPSNLSLIDNEPRQDGTLRVHGCFRPVCAAEPLPKDMRFAGLPLVSYPDMETQAANIRILEINMPEQVQEWRALSGTLHTARADGRDSAVDEAELSYALVTPFGVMLSDYLPEEITEKMDAQADRDISQKVHDEVYDIQAEDITVWKLSQGAHAAAPLYLTDDQNAFQAETASLYVHRFINGNSEETVCQTFILPFKVPQDLSDADAMEFTSAVQDTPVTVDLTPEKLPFTPELDPDKAEINVFSEPAETTAPETPETAAAVQVPAETKISTQKPAETKINTQKPADTQTAEALIEKISEQLNALTWSSETCDGLPEYQWTGADGTVYRLNLSSRWVWKRADGTIQEAHLTKNLLDLFSAYQAGYGLDECEY